jgi:hypothetical protein
VATVSNLSQVEDHTVAAKKSKKKKKRKKERKEGALHLLLHSYRL